MLYVRKPTFLDSLYCMAGKVPVHPVATALEVLVCSSMTKPYGVLYFEARPGCAVHTCRREPHALYCTSAWFFACLRSAVVVIAVVSRCALQQWTRQAAECSARQEQTRSQHPAALQRATRHDVRDVPRDAAHAGATAQVWHWLPRVAGVCAVSITNDRRSWRVGAWRQAIYKYMLRDFKLCVWRHATDGFSFTSRC